MRAYKTLSAIAFAAVAAGAQAGIVGDWELNGNLNATVGTNAAAGGSVKFETAIIGGKTAQVARVGDNANDGNATWTYNTGSYLEFDNPIGKSPTGPVFKGSDGFPYWGMDRTYNYTILADVYIPGMSAWRGFFDTEYAENNTWANHWHESELWLDKDNKAGVEGIYSGNPFPVDQWARIALVADLGSRLDGHNDGKMYQLYVNGEIFNTMSGDPWAGLVQRFTLGKKFTLAYDPWEEDCEMLLGAVQLQDTSMTAAEIRALGGPKATGFAAVPEPASMTVLALGALGVLARRRKK